MRSTNQTPETATLKPHHRRGTMVIDGTKTTVIEIERKRPLGLRSISLVLFPGEAKGVYVDTKRIDFWY